MPFKAAASREGTGGLPILNVEAGKAKRIRFIGQNNLPDLKGTKYAEVTQEYFQHWVPDDAKKALGLSRDATVTCIGPRSGCIFHQDPLNWKTSRKSVANVIEYVDYDVKKKTYTSRRIVAMVGGVKVFEQMLAHLNTVGGEPDMVDFILARSGTGKETNWNATLTDCLDKGDMGWEEFEDQPEAYQLDGISILLDSDKFPGYEVTTAAGQREWYDKLLAEAAGEEKKPGEEAEPDPNTPPKPPGATPTASTASTTAVKAKITMPGDSTEPQKFTGPNGETWGGRGRKPKWYTDQEEAAAAGGSAEPPPPPSSEPEPPAPDEPGYGEAQAAYEEACTVLDPWAKPLSESEHLDFVVGLDGNAAKIKQYKITQETVDAAKIVQAGPPSEGESEDTEDAPPPPPAASAPAVGKADVPAMQQELLKLAKSTACTSNFQGMKKFVTVLCGGAKTPATVEDPALLKKLIALFKKGNDAVEAAITAGKV